MATKDYLINYEKLRQNTLKCTEVGVVVFTQGIVLLTHTSGLGGSNHTSAPCVWNSHLLSVLHRSPLADVIPFWIKKT